jgi:hypothetical protein
MQPAFGYILYPPVWLGAPPRLASREDLQATWDVISHASLPQGINATAFRNGIFIFDVDAWAQGAPAPESEWGISTSSRNEFVGEASYSMPI